MKRSLFIGWSLLISVMVSGQLSFRTVVSPQPVIEGEPLQVQYILEGNAADFTISPPSFPHFRLVSGPNVHRGTVNSANGTQPLHNEAYTLEAGSAGQYEIAGAMVTINGKILQSNRVLVTVITRDEAYRRLAQDKSAAGSNYFLRPGEDPYQKIRDNLFIKVNVDRKNCVPGQPVLATFKLYSRLESKSDIVKNPGFYGFTVFDMVNLADKQVDVETINGKAFDVHTVRKVQLYPLQPGVFTIDPMEIRTTVEFSRKVLNKKTEQEVSEGMLGKHHDAPSEGATIFESSISSDPITITVKPLPEKNKPATYTGATGHFTIAIAVNKDSLARNEQGFLDITIHGKGNFIQLDAPVVAWPKGMEVFEPVIRDELDKTSLPLSGSRRFRFPFVCATDGRLEIPAIRFSFFDTDSNSFRTIQSGKASVVIAGERKIEVPVVSTKRSIAETSERAARIAGIIVVAVVLLILVYWAFFRKEVPVAPIAPPAPPPPTIDEQLQPVLEAAGRSSNEFYRSLQLVLWQAATGRYHLQPGDRSKYQLLQRMEAESLPIDLQNEWIDLLTSCETGLYTTVQIESEQETLLQRTRHLLERLGD